MTGFSGFSRTDIETNGTRLSVHTGGNGPPLVLLHGFPQNHMCWEKVIGDLAERFNCIVPDLRGYGGSACPPDDSGHFAYSKRNMARDIVGMMDALGIEQSAFVGHDRGARVTYRLALDHPRRVARIVIVEVVPTEEFWRRWNAEIALAGYHWTFLAQPAPLPETLIGSNPKYFVERTVASWTAAGNCDAFGREALNSYISQMMDPERVAAMCSDYRAGATTDRRIDEADILAGRKILAPVKFVWSEVGFPSTTGDPLGIWRSWCEDLAGECVPDCGHFMMEENPAGFLKACTDFLAGRQE